ncbi:MAG: LuxR C-terminal-related transcriptional regulator [Pseudomonadota bacterium]|jgi:DNA-binding CsgD family transcriptional regulator
MDSATKAISGRFTMAGQEYRLHHVDISGVRPREGDTFETLLCRMAAAPIDELSLYECTATIAADLGFHSFSYGCLYPRLQGPPVLHVCTPLPFDVWMEYHESGLMECDEAVHHCRHSIVPTVWTMAESAMRRHSPEMARKLEKWWVARLVFPVHGTHGEVAMLAFNSACSRETAGLGARLYEALAKGQLVAAHLHAQLCRLTGLATDIGTLHEPLTERELAVLALVAKGHENETIGTLLGISARTVKFHFSNVLQKLGCTRRVDAVTRAIELGLVFPGSLSPPVPARGTTAVGQLSAVKQRKVSGPCYREFPEFPILPFDPTEYGFVEDVSSKQDPVQCPAFETKDRAY